MKYPIYVAVSTFGKIPELNSDGAIDEYKAFIENNSNFLMNISRKELPALASDEIPLWSSFYGYTSNCYFPDPSKFRQTTLNAIPVYVNVNIILYNMEGLSPICVGGATWNPYIHNRPTVIIPLDPSANASCDGWSVGLTQSLVHEWLHTVNYEITRKGFSFPNSDDCTNYGFTSSGCWHDCYQYFLSLITDQMYNDVYVCSPTVTLNI